jgi:hypothetical protein
VKWAEQNCNLFQNICFYNWLPPITMHALASALLTDQSKQERNNLKTSCDNVSEEKKQKQD